MRRFWLLFSQFVTVVLAVVFVLGTLKPTWLRALRSGRVLPPLNLVQDRGHDGAAAGHLAADQGMSFRDAVKAAAPSVVSIMVSKSEESKAKEAQDPWFQFFFGDQSGRNSQGVQKGQGDQEDQTNPWDGDTGDDDQEALGSGVIVSASGYVLTNDHVVDGADDIEVVLADGRKSKAQVVGTDPDSDLAVLKINLPRLPVITWGSLDDVQVGDAVLAIGNPFGVGQTVTSGIVSGLGRNHLGINTFENFIQTDAAINPGNSGGALVDAQGHLLGINTAIYTQSGGSMGIGFAIPVSLAKQVLESLVKDGHVTRGWIGVEPQDLSPELAQAFGLSGQAQGVIVTGVLRNGPAQKAGIQPGDVVTQVAGRAVRNTSDLLAQIAALKPGAAVELRLNRKGQTLTLKITPGLRPTQRETKE